MKTRTRKFTEGLIRLDIYVLPETEKDILKLAKKHIGRAVDADGRVVDAAVVMGRVVDVAMAATMARPRHVEINEFLAKAIKKQLGAD